MTPLREKAAALLRLAREIQIEDYFNDVTPDEQARLEEIVKTINVTANLILLHIRPRARNAARRIVDAARPKTKLRVIK